jgi:hypothetical protein
LVILVFNVSVLFLHLYARLRRLLFAKSAKIVVVKHIIAKLHLFRFLGLDNRTFYFLCWILVILFCLYHNFCLFMTDME